MAYDEYGNKVDGRKFNRGHKGLAGRKPKTYETKLAEKLSDVEDDIIEVIKKKALGGDKDMIKLYMAYLHGQPKVKTENETTVTSQSIQMKDLLNKLKEDFDDSDFEFDED